MFSEREKKPSVPEGVREVPQDLSLPVNIEAKDNGIQSVPSQFSAQVMDGGQPLIQTSQNQTVTITLPADTQTIADNAKKGNIVDAATWFFAFWARAFKKAIHFGWQIVAKPETEN